MTTTTANPAARTAANTPVPIVPPAAMRHLPVAVFGVTGGLTLVLLAVVLATGRGDWWPALGASVVIAVLNAVASVAVLGNAVNKTVDWLVTLTMGATLARMAVSAIGLLVAVKVFHTPPEPTAVGVCGYYAAVLVVETTLLARATRVPASTSSVSSVSAVGEPHV